MTTTQPAELPAIAGGTPAKQTPYGSERRYGEEELGELEEALNQGTLFYAQGKKVHQLETEFAAKNGVAFAVATSSGTATLHAALIAAGISPGDEVIVSPITDMGSVVPILYQGAVPVFADLHPHTYTLDPAAVEAAITPQTRAVLAVHLAGNACAMDELTAIARRHDLAVIEDCAQAFGATYRGQPIGAIGVIGCFSYNEFKHISCGDGGGAGGGAQPWGRGPRRQPDVRARHARAETPLRRGRSLRPRGLGRRPTCHAIHALALRAERREAFAWNEEPRRIAAQEKRA